MILRSLEKYRSILLFAITAVYISIYLPACDPGTIYEQNLTIPGTKWNRDFIPVFTPEITDTLMLHDLIINLRNTGEYPMSNLFLFISARSPGGAFTRDTLELVLAEPSGRWKGKGFGNVWQNRFYYRRNVRFPETGKYVIEIEQAMRMEDLPGILDVGLRIEQK